MGREEQLEEAIADLVAAMKKSVREGSTDHLDCHNDGGAFWYDAIDNAEKLLNV